MIYLQSIPNGLQPFPCQEYDPSTAIEGLQKLVAMERMHRIKGQGKNGFLCDRRLLRESTDS
jgi:hypothetical protein